MPPALLAVAGNQSNCALEVSTSTLSALEMTQKQYQARADIFVETVTQSLPKKSWDLSSYASLFCIGSGIELLTGAIFGHFRGRHLAIKGALSP